jgi:hypothetical protein
VPPLAAGIGCHDATNPGFDGSGYSLAWFYGCCMDDEQLQRAMEPLEAASLELVTLGNLIPDDDELNTRHHLNNATGEVQEALGILNS